MKMCYPFKLSVFVSADANHQQAMTDIAKDRASKIPEE
jgi:hypothetical protein